MIYEDFTFTDWFWNEELEEFYSKTKDLFNHDRCAYCNVWVQTITKRKSGTHCALLVTCPNCGAQESFV